MPCQMFMFLVIIVQKKKFINIIIDCRESVVSTRELLYSL